MEEDPNRVEEPLITVTQVMRGVPGVDFMPHHMSKFESSLSQWMDVSLQPLADTPSCKVLPERGANIPSAEDVDSCCGKLYGAFEEERNMEATKQLVGLSNAGPRPPETMIPSTLLIDGTFSGSSSACRISNASPFKNRTLGEVYIKLGIDVFLKGIACGGKGTIRKSETVFFNHYGKELILKHKAIYSLKDSEARLENDVVDFVLSRLYMAYSEERRYKIHIVSLRVSTFLLIFMSLGKSGKIC